MDVVAHFGLSQDPFRTPEPDSLAGGALTPDAARAYLAGRIAGAGAPGLFSRSALDILADAAMGNPDLLRRLGGSALFHAAFEGARRVEDHHARQAAATQGCRVAVGDLAPAASAVAAIHSVGAGAAAVDTLRPDPVTVHRRWWRRTPPITRLAIVVGLLLLSLPVIGYIVGAVKDSQTSGSSYLPENSIVDAERIAPAETEVLAMNPDGAATTLPAAAPARPPARLDPPATSTPLRRPAVSPPEPVLEAPVEAEPPAAPLPEAEPPLAEQVPAAPPPQLDTVPIDPPAEPATDATIATPQASLELTAGVR